MSAPFVKQPRPLGADEPEARVARPYAVINIAEIAEEPQIEDADAIDQGPLQENCVAGKYLILYITRTRRGEKYRAKNSRYADSSAAFAWAPPCARYGCR